MSAYTTFNDTDTNSNATYPVSLSPDNTSGSGSSTIGKLSYGTECNMDSLMGASQRTSNTSLKINNNSYAKDLPESGSVANSMTKLTKRESYKVQRKNYRMEKKRVNQEVLNMLKDPSITIMSDWLKVRGSLKGWTKLWCVLKPGLLLLYKSPKTSKNSQWVGTLLLSTCELIERPSKKNGFCFKLFHPLEQSIWATRGPGGESLGSMTQPLPTTHLICRAESEAAGKCWMDALELTIRCSGMLIRSMTNQRNNNVPEKDNTRVSTSSSGSHSSSVNVRLLAAEDSDINLVNPSLTCTVSAVANASEGFVATSPCWTASDYERHFKDQDLDDDAQTDDGGYGEEDDAFLLSESDEDTECCDAIAANSASSNEKANENNGSGEHASKPIETPYVLGGVEEFGLVGDAGQTEEVADENKSMIWTLVKQVRPGMDLSRIILPTFILEPRSFLDKLTDYHYHGDIVSGAVVEDDPYTRMKLIVKWYVSGFYKKPKGIKKPYNSILGETFRCFWKHPGSNSRSFYIAEQVSHHPPISAIYVSNRKDGFCLTGNILTKSKFYGNSVSAILEGVGTLTLLPRGEQYKLTLPYIHCKGILMGTMTMELGGEVMIECEKTGYKTEMEFKLRPFLSGSEYSNIIRGKIRLGKESIATIDGHWDQCINITEKRTGETSVLWHATPDVRAMRLQRFTVAMDSQTDYESERLWQYVSDAILNCDQLKATDEKTILEEAQREKARVRKETGDEWLPRHFVLDPVSGEYVYKHADLRPWDPRTDVLEYECNFIIGTQTKHKAPRVKLGAVEDTIDSAKMVGVENSKTKKRERAHGDDHQLFMQTSQESKSSNEDGDNASKVAALAVDTVTTTLRSIELAQKEISNRLVNLSHQIDHISTRQTDIERAGIQREWTIYLIIFITQAILMYFFMGSPAGNGGSRSR